MECDFRRLCESALTVRRLRRSSTSSSRRHSPARGGAASFGGLRSRLGLILAVIAALALMAGGPPILNGVDTLGLSEDGDVLSTVSGGVIHINEIAYESYISRDGGVSWALLDGPPYALYDFQSVDTPRGKYVIDELGVARLGADGRRELVYSTEYL